MKSLLTLLLLLGIVAARKTETNGHEADYQCNTVIKGATCRCPDGIFDLLSDNLHCGSCTKQCNLGERCHRARCVCLDGLAKCGNECVDLLTDPHNCGCCKNVCEGSCVDGECFSCGNVNCHKPETCCNDNCVNLHTDNNNCGQCGLKCKNGSNCIEGTCRSCGTVDCPLNESCCNNTCVNLLTDINNCGQCGFQCENGDCVGGICRSCGAVDCPLNESCCNQTCVNLLTDNNNCGQCGSACAAGLNCCGGECFDLQFNNLNCGECGFECPVNETCCSGKCFNLMDSVINCGICGNSCDVDASCCSGTCDPGVCSCESGFIECGNVCVPIDNQNCFQCGVVCQSPFECCTSASGCVDISSNPSFCGDCQTQCAATESCCNGTCTDISTIANCGDCGNVCAQPVFPNAIAVCVGSECGIECNSGFSACGTPLQACCTPAETCCNNACVVLGTELNCAACGDVCGSGELCCNGQCTNISSTVNCGECGKVCPVPTFPNAVPTCDGVNCGFACNSGFQACGATEVTACCGQGETCCADVCVTLGTIANCNGCGDACSIGQGCCNSQCVNLNTIQNCGQCAPCDPPPFVSTVYICNNSLQCELVCAPGFTDCDGNILNGCEAGPGEVCCGTQAAAVGKCCSISPIVIAGTNEVCCGNQIADEGKCCSTSPIVIAPDGAACCGSVICFAVSWGSNDRSQLAPISPILERNLPGPINTPVRFVFIESGFRVSFGIDEQGNLYGWGDNVPRLGLGIQPSNVAIPTLLSSSQKFKFVSSGPRHTLAIDILNRVWSWGVNSDNQLGYSGLGQNTPQLITSIQNENIVKVCAGDDFSLALRSDGTYYAWGRNNQQQFGTSGGPSSSVTPFLVSDIIYTDIAVGGYYGLGINNGIIYSWGDNILGQLGQGNNSAFEPRGLAILPIGVLFKKVFARLGGSSCAIALNDDLYCWGGNSNGQSGVNSNANSINVPTFVMSNVFTASSGNSHRLALLNNGSLYAFGRNDDGELGNGNNIDQDSPVLVGNGYIYDTTLVQPVSAGENHSMGILKV